MRELVRELPRYGYQLLELGVGALLVLAQLDLLVIDADVPGLIGDSEPRFGIAHRKGLQGKHRFP